MCFDRQFDRRIDALPGKRTLQLVQEFFINLAYLLTHCFNEAAVIRHCYVHGTTTSCETGGVRPECKSPDSQNHTAAESLNQQRTSKHVANLKQIHQALKNENRESVCQNWQIFGSSFNMTTWRMSFRAGTQGHEMWPDCWKLGVAAISYGGVEKTDFSKYPEGEPRKLWALLKPTQKASLHRVVYEMKGGDVIYVKQGPKIVSKGIVKGRHGERAYRFDAKYRLKTPDGWPWAHQVPVKWASDFPEIGILLGSELLTVKDLSGDKLKQLKERVHQVTKVNKQVEALEGETYTTEAIFRSRNRALILAKKTNSDYRCEVCGFNFEETYGLIGRGYILAHHLRLIAHGPSKTTLDDIGLVCANCHAMIHTKNPPISIQELRNMVKHH